MASVIDRTTHEQAMDLLRQDKAALKRMLDVRDAEIASARRRIIELEAELSKCRRL